MLLQSEKGMQVSRGLNNGSDSCIRIVLKVPGHPAITLYLPFSLTMFIGTRATCAVERNACQKQAALVCSLVHTHGSDVNG